MKKQFKHFTGMANRKKRVAIVGIQGVPAHYGGFETFVDNLIGQESADGIEYTVFCSKVDLPTRMKEYKGAQLKYLPLHSNGIESVLYDCLSMLCAIRRNDTILILGISGCVFVPIVKMFSHAKILINIDGLEHRRKKWNHFARRYLRFSEKAAVRFADSVIVDNKGIQDYVTQTYHKSSELIAYGGDQVLLNVSEDRQREVLDKFKLCKGEYAVTVCRIEPENNVDMILDAFVETCGRIVVVGNFQGHIYSQRLLNQYEKFSNILMLDAVYDKELLYILRHNAAYYVHGHSAGGTNPALVEAMFFGRPILAYDVVYNRETTQNKANYFSDKEELIALMERAAHLDGAPLKDVAYERYQWKNIAEQYEELY